MKKDNTDCIIAHVDLLHALDTLLLAAETLRKKRAVLDELLGVAARKPRQAAAEAHRRRKKGGATWARHFSPVA